MDSNGWDDVGQQLTISRGGHVLEGRNRSLPAIREGSHVLGAHTANHNSHTVGIENEGTYSSAAPPNDLWQALADTCAWLCLVYGLSPHSAIVGHRDYNSTGCPGDQLYSMLPELRSQVATRLRAVDRMLAEEGRDSDVPSGHRPTYPDVPERERTARFEHGPAVGS